MPYNDKSLKQWGFLILIAIAAFITLQIALNTPFNYHPDEIMHADAICYFESRWWPPSLGSSEVTYSPAGWSRVYTGEVVYLIYGKMSALAKPIALRIFAAPVIESSPSPFPPRVYLPVVLRLPNCIMSPKLYRILNVSLLILTLFVVFLRGHQNVWVLVMGLTLLCIPQALYVYAYANSDAWGLSISIFLFVFILTAKAQIGSPRYAILLGLLVGLLLLSKESFWLSLSWISVLVGAQYFQQWKQNTLKLSFMRTVSFFAVFFTVVLLIVSPLKLIYPLTQGEWDIKVEEMKEIKAWDGAKPSNITRPGYRLAARNEPITVIIHNRYWFDMLVKSFYGVFGYFTVVLPNWVYIAALVMLVLNLGITIGMVWSKWSLLSFMAKALLICAPFSILLNIAASIYSSWTYDFQPQGRYLFSSLIPLAVLVAGTVSVESKKSMSLRIISWLICYGLCIYVLINYAM